jgi:hypothetical protein
LTNFYIFLTKSCWEKDILGLIFPVCNTAIEYVFG